MCLRPRPVDPIPEETARVAKAAFPKGTIYLAMRDELGAVFEAAYARRAGIEGTVSRAVRTCGVRRSRYVGLEKTQIHHLLSAAALNFVRVGEWLMGMPKATTRRSPFARLIAAPAAA